MKEKTLVILKPDSVERKLCGKIITTFEDAGLTITEIKMITPSKELVNQHYPNNNKWFTSVGNKSLSNYAEQGLDIIKVMGTDDPMTVGKKIKEWLVDYMSSGKVIAMVIEGNNAIKNVRKLVGNTVPMNADPSTIRGRFECDSSDTANAENRPLRNLVHASGEPDEAKFEISLWFGETK